MKTVLAVLLTAILVVHADRELTRSEYDKIQENYILPNGSILLYLLFFSFAALLFTYPPESLVGGGVTSENLFSSYLGNAEPDILTYHCRRVVLNRGLLFFYPIAFFLLLCFMEEAAVIFTFYPTRLLHYLANCSIPTMFMGFFYMFYHNWTNYRYITPRRFINRDTITLNREIAVEMMNLDAFKYNLSSSSKLVITQSWILYSSKFTFQLALLEEATLHVVKAEEIILNPLNPEGAVQLMTIKIVVPHVCGGDIYVKMHNVTLQDMMTTLNARVEIPPNIAFKLSTVDQFAKVFADEAAKNAPFYVDSMEELEPCLACAEKPANMKLVKRCPILPEEEQERCRECQCRPMWCVNCMGKVFAAKQNQQASAHWITGKAPCPTCRAIFCIFDVALVKVRNSEPG